ncbi:MAG: 2-methylcitrate dehydratase 2 [Phycisphaerae bacterium]|nr:2-methylcitrate dehydratase 2 [Phycisphaerae bacterium]
MATLASRLAKWTLEQKFNKLPTATVHEVKRRVIDSIGCALGAYHKSPAKITRQKATSVSDKNGATILGTTHRTTPELAAFTNGAMVRYLDFNDTYLSLEPAHPSDNIPAAWAMAESLGRSGQDFITASVIGYEIQCRLCDAASLRKHGWDHPYWGVLSTVLLAGWLMKIDAAQLEHALGLAGVCNIPTRQTRTGQLPMWKACAFSNAARNGIFAADLARLGMTGPHEIFEGPKGIFKMLVDGPFEPQLAGSQRAAGFSDSKMNTTLINADYDGYMIDKTYIKYWPAEYHSQSAIDAALQLRKEIAGREIKTLEIASFEAAVSIIGSEPEKWRPTSRETADHSMGYCVACAFIDGDVTRESFSEEKIRDPKYLNLLDKIRIYEDPQLNAGYPKGIPNHLKVTLADGTKLDKRVDYPRGHAGNPMTDDEVISKFMRNARSVITDATAQKIIDTAWKLDRLESISDLLSFEVL